MFGIFEFDIGVKSVEWVFNVGGKLNVHPNRQISLEGAAKPLE